MVIVLIFEEEVTRVVCACVLQAGKSECQIDQFYNDMANKWDCPNPGKMVLYLEDFNRNGGRRIDGFEGKHVSMDLAKEMLTGRRLFEFCDEKELWGANTWFEKKEQRKITCSMGGNETEINFVMVGKNNKNYLKDEKINPRKL